MEQNTWFIRDTHFIGSHIIWATVGYGGGRQNYISASWHIATKAATVVVLLLSLVGSNAFDIKRCALVLLHKWQNDQNIFPALPSPPSPIITQHIFLILLCTMTSFTMTRTFHTLVFFTQVLK